MAVADVEHARAAEEVDEGVAIDVLHGCAATLFDRHGHAAGIGAGARLELVLLGQHLARERTGHLAVERRGGLEMQLLEVLLPLAHLSGLRRL